MKLNPIKNTFIFKFLDTINGKGQFDKPATETGIILQSSFDDSAKEPRWVKVTTTGPDCKDIRTDDVVLLPALRWTSGVKFEEEKIWKSDEMQVVATLTDGTIKPLRNFVIFRKFAEEEKVSSFGLVIVGDPQAYSPRGTVVAVGPSCVDAIVGDTMFYDDTNFFDTFMHDGVEYCFIKEENIIAFA